MSFEEELAEIEQKEVSAILDLDFERALDISKQRKQTQQDEADDEEAFYQEQAEILSQKNQAIYNQKLESISQEFLENSNKFKQLWQGYCNALAERQRDEAHELEQKWRQARSVEIQRTTEAAKARLSTARVLAMCQQFEKAVEVRDSAQSLIDNEKTDRVKSLDRDYTQQYRQMTKRHFQEFQYLYEQLKKLLKTLKEKAETQKIDAEATLRTEEVHNTSMIMETVSRNPVSPATRENLMKTFSPRGKQQQSSTRPRSMFSNRSRSSGRSTPMKGKTLSSSYLASPLTS